MLSCFSNPLPTHVPVRSPRGLSIVPSSLPTPYHDHPLHSGRLVRKAFSLTTDEEQNQCCWQGRHELQAWRVQFPCCIPPLVVIR